MQDKLKCFYLPRQHLPQHHGAERIRPSGGGSKHGRLFEIDSAATSREEIGNTPHYGTVRKLREENVPLIHTGHVG